jgi:hypothetical protein
VVRFFFSREAALQNARETTLQNAREAALQKRKNEWEYYSSLTLKQSLERTL